MFFAHSTQRNDRSDWQPLAEHLQNVAALAADRATIFGASELARVAGLLHDLGKYSDEFQRRIAGDAIRVDHATHGARLSVERYMPIGTLLAYGIAGHHAGLANGSEGSGYEGISRIFHTDSIALSPRTHAVARGRLVAGAALGYAVDTPPDFGLPAPQAWTLRGMSMGTVLLFVFAGLIVVYRLGPSGQHPGLIWTLPGAVVATLIWAAASFGFTLYVSNFATYDLMYGPLGAVVALLMWFWVSVFVVLLGAELNVALMEQHASTAA